MYQQLFLIYIITSILLAKPQLRNACSLIYELFIYWLSINHNLLFDYLFFIEIHPTVQSYSIMTKTCFVDFDPMNVSFKPPSQCCYSLDISKYIRKTNDFKFTTAPRKVTSMLNKGYWYIYQQLCYTRRSKQKSDRSIYWKKKIQKYISLAAGHV
jgi:hypothetical protein